MKMTVYICQAADNGSHKGNLIFTVNEEPGRLPTCPICHCQDNIYEHAIAEMKIIEVLNVDV